MNIKDLGKGLGKDEREVVILAAEDGTASISTNSPLWYKKLVSHLGAADEVYMGNARWKLSAEQVLMPKRSK